MQLETPHAGNPRWMTVVGWILTALPTALLLFSASGKLLKPQPLIESFEKKMGWSESHLLPLAIVEIACALIYVFPRTAVLGAILVTGYLGGAVATHVRLHDYGDAVGPIVFGVLAWGGIWLRLPALRQLMPWR